MQITFWGAARQVTGSMFQLSLDDDFNILIDCGLDLQRGPQDTLQDRPGIFPFEPSQIQLLVLTHAHIDHSGYIPNLVREGFEGSILCTPATADLSYLLLQDSASLNQRKLKRLSNIGKKDKEAYQNAQAQIKNLYLFPQVDESMRLFQTLPFLQRKKIHKKIYLTLIPAGHLLGAANVLLEIEEEKGKFKKICFSGDIGRYNYPLLDDPSPVPPVDYLVCESTYGNRLHQNQGSPEEVLYEVIQDTCIERQGKLIIPAFSVGRTQALLYTLNKLCIQGKLPPVKIFTDSPLALQSTKIYEKHRSLLNQEAKDFFSAHSQLFDFQNLIYLENIKDSKAVSDYPHPCIIISSSGMIQGGRIEHHIRKNLQNEKATILMIGYAAEGTMGYDLIQGIKEVQEKKKTIEVKARIATIDVFSGHGDLNDLLRFVKQQSPQELKKLFLVHGEYESMKAFKNTLGQEGYPAVEIPEKGQSFTL